MAEVQLPNPPIVEALVEVRWAMEKTSEQNPDPYYQLLLGSFYQKIKKDYPFHEALPASSIPDEITGSVVKHRFRVAENSWPLIQIGPGIMTINQSDGYTTFEKFKPMPINAINALFEIHPNPKELKIKNLVLRYIDAVKVDCSQVNILDFISDSMHTPVKLPNFIIQDENFEKKPTGLKWQTSLRCHQPAGMATLAFSTGTREGKPALIWEQILKSENDDIDEMPQKFETWIDSAHNVVHKWFQNIIEGDLRTEFSRNG
ncbi:MAG: TIGR04255 family protein [Planctomycetaceae bacterium]|nr:TIGR04255 family protein [Planctomycetaceae bacterium]